MGKLNKNRIRIAIVAALSLMICLASATAAGGAAQTHDSIPAQDTASGFQPSNRHTQPEQPAGPIGPRFTTDGYDLVAADGALELYAATDRPAFLVKDTRSGYIWSTTPAEDDYDPKEFNEVWLSKLISPFVLQFIDSGTAVQGEASYAADGGRIESRAELPNGVRYSVYLDKVQLGLDIEVTLDDGELIVRIPEGGIREDGAAKILTIQPFPFFGTVPGGKVPGYLFVPDGSGALIRFQDVHSFYEEAYAAPVYYEDYAVTYYNSRLARRGVSAPVFGMVHGAGQHGWLGVIEDGKYDAEVYASPSGVNTPFNSTSARFTVRHAYFLPTSKNGAGVNTYQRQPIAGDRQVRYLFLTGLAADYSGMASAYREYLARRDGLPPPVAGGDIPLNLTLLCAEQEPGLLWKNLVRMTDYEQAGAIVRDLTDEGVSRMVVTLNGWNRGGFDGDFKYKTAVERSLGGEAKLKAFIADARALGHRVFLFRQYDWFTDGAAGLSPRADAVRLINNDIVRMEDEGPYRSIYYLNPAVSARLAAADSAPFNRRFGGPGSAMNGMFLLSDFNERRLPTREQAAQRKLELYDALQSGDGLISFAPSEFLWSRVSDAMDVSLFNSQYVYFTDTVPFLQMVLHGRVHYYTGTINLAADSRELILRAIDYGAYPSFYITAEPAWKLQYSASQMLFTSEYAVWKDEIVKDYQKMNAVLSRVAGQEIVGRKVYVDGVVGTTYESGDTVYVNYTDKPVSVNGVSIPAEDAVVSEGGR